ncbi:MAG TPA: rhomboid family intramembrane serine protease [Candidatus Elarobacter sp.]|nr:rhomboid family intramembrane serine protease [Candidatus Elarobacter sp.]
MIPIGDDLPTRRVPWVNYLLIAATIASWIWVQGAGLDGYRLAATVCDLGMVPGEITHRAPLGLAVPLGPGLACVVDNSAINYLTPLISLFLHGSWGHLLGNMLFLWVFGDNVEDALGHSRYLAFYLICGLAAGAAQIFSDPASPIPTVGASGAISGMMGAYLLLYPGAQVRVFFIIFITRVRAWIVLVYWFLLQLFEGLARTGPIRPEVSSGVAVWAHVGGFLAGLLLVKFFTPRAVAAPYGSR